MPLASDLAPDKGMKCLFVGRSGSGKKAAACTYPGPIYYFDFDGRIDGIRGCPWIDKTQVEYDYYPPEAGIVERTEKKLQSIIADYNGNSMRYKTIILGSITGQTFAYLQQGNVLTHGLDGGKKAGKFIGQVAMPGPAEYGFEAMATYNLLATLRKMRETNIIVTAHVIDRYGKKDASDPYSESTIVGTKLSVRDKIGENSLIYFNEIYEFSKESLGNTIQHKVRFRSDLCRTTYSQLPNGQVDISGINFYKRLSEITK